MSCFWQGLARITELNGKAPKEVLTYLKDNNAICSGVKWQGELLSKKQLHENYESIAQYNHNVNKGHLTSSCDPFLILCSFLFHINIIFIYNKNKIVITNDNSKETIHFQANEQHFS